MQETHSTKQNKIRWIDFNSQIHYSHSKSNSRCSYCFFISITYTVKKKTSDNHGSILIKEAFIDDTEYVLIKFYSANTENDQLTTFSELTNLLEKFGLIEINQ